MKDHRLNAFEHLFEEKYGNELPLPPSRQLYLEVTCSCVMRLNQPNKPDVCSFTLKMCV